MSKKKLIGFILQLPLVLVFLASLVASYYAAYNSIQNINYATPVFFTVVFVFYLVGIFLMRDKKDGGYQK